MLPIVAKMSEKGKSPAATKSAFATRDAAGRPFYVTHDDDGMMKVYKLVTGAGGAQEKGDKVFGLKVTAFYVGDDPSRISPTWDRSMKGNTVIAQVAPQKFIFVGDRAFYFYIHPGDKIVEYISPVGANEMPTPYVIGEKYTYLLTSDVSLDNRVLDLRKDVYAQYMGREKLLSGAVRSYVRKLVAERNGTMVGKIETEDKPVAPPAKAEKPAGSSRAAGKSTKKTTHKPSVLEDSDGDVEIE